jgi:hypothetical protein
MKFIEKLLLNTHYYIKPTSQLKLSNDHHYTITPTIIDQLVNKTNTIYFTTDQKWLVQLDHNEIIDNYNKLYSYVMFDDYDMICTTKDNWFEKYWNKPFLVTNPIYEYEDEFYVFSNKYIKPVLLDTSLNIIDQIIEAGAFTIGNGIIMALSLINLKIIKEEDFIKKLDQLDPKHNLFHLFSKKWTPYFYHNSCHLIDHIFKYAFIHNSPKIYQYIYNLTHESSIIYHINQRCISTLFSLVTRNDQIKFVKKFIHKYKSDVHTYVVDLYVLFKLKDFKYIKTILEITHIKLGYIIYVINHLYNSYHKRHIKHLWRFLLKNFSNEWSSAIEKYIMTQIYIYDTRTSKIPIFSKKLIRDFIHLTPFEYNSNWKNLFKYIHIYLETPNYNRILEVKIIKKLLTLQQIANSHPDGHLVSFIVKDYFKDHKQLLLT